MVPNNGNIIWTEKVEERKIPSFTYGMNEEKGEIRGNKDGLEAVKQAIYKILMTERYQYLIYDFQYGIELKDLFGKSIGFVILEAEKRIREALLADDRILDVRDFSFSEQENALLVRFLVETEYGAVEMERMVER